MEAGVPIYGHTATDYKKAVLLYRRKFRQNPPRTGTEEARYAAMVYALDGNEPATEADVTRFEEIVLPGPQLRK